MKVLIVTDGSPEARNALVFSSQIIKRIDVQTEILTTVTDSNDSLLNQAEDILATALDIVGVQDAETRVQIGDPYEKIIQEASEGNFDLIIIGDKRPHFLLPRFLSRTLATKVAEYAPCSVIVVRGKIQVIHRILMCDSGVGGSPTLSRLVVQLSNLIEGKEDVTVLHVMSQISAGPGVRGKQLRADAQELVEEETPEGEILGRDLQMLDKPGIQPIPKVRHGLVVDEILSEALSGDYDLVVLGAHSTAAPQSFLLENIADQIMQQINRPILIVREKGSQVRSNQISS